MHVDRENIDNFEIRSKQKKICNFGRRSQQKDKISATLSEEVCRETKNLQL
jgi:hypothetical protein